MSKLFKTISVFLVLSLVASVTPLLAINSLAANVTYSGSSSYMNGIYYDRLMDVVLTGNQADDIVNIALSQEGYTSGGSNSDLSGQSTQKANYTEYGKKIGVNPNPWCAYFVSWCARLAGISETVLPSFSGCTSATNNFRKKDWGKTGTWYDGYVLDTNSSYVPQKGDLVFYSWNQNYPEDTYSVDHVGIVIKDSTSNSSIYTIEGNTSDKVGQKTLTPTKPSKYSNTKYVVGYFSPDYSTNESQLGVLSIKTPQNLEYLNPTNPGSVSWSSFSGAKSYRYTIREQKYDVQNGGYVDTDNYLCSRVLTTSTSFSLDKEINDNLSDYVKSQGAYKIWVGAHSDSAGTQLIAERIITVCMETQTTETPDLTNPYIEKNYYSQDLYTGTYSGLVPIDEDLTISWENTGDYYKIAVKALDGTPSPSENEDGTTLVSYREVTTNRITINQSTLEDYAGQYIKIAINAVKYGCDNAKSANYYFKLEDEPTIDDETTMPPLPSSVNIKFERNLYEVPLYNDRGNLSSDFTVRFVDLDTAYTTSWEMSNNNVAKIKRSSLNECRVSVVSAGTTTLTVTVNVGGKLYEKSCTIIITDEDETTTKEPITNPPAEDIRINFEKSIYEVPLFDELGDPTPAFHVIFADPSVDYTASWEIENTAVAKIIYSYKNECMVSAVSAGTTTLTAKVNVGGKLYTQSCTIRVTNSNGGNDEPSTQPGTQEPTKYTLTLDPNGGYVNPTKYTKTSGTVITLPTPTKSETVTFDATGGTGGPNEQNIYYGTIGWKVNKNNGVPEYNCGDSFKFGEENITLLMIWDIAAQGKLTTETPHRSGYTFLGWATTANAVSAIYRPGDNITLTRGKTLYAVWEQTEVPDKTATSCRIISAPTKTSYMYLETTQPDLTGLILEITYSDGTKENIIDNDNITVRGFDTKSIGSKVVTVEYEDVSAQFTINVSYSWWQWIIRIVLFGWIWY